MHDVDTIERQIRQVRRRRNLHEAQRGLLILTATAAGSAAAVVLLALVASPALFAVATWSAAGAVTVTAALLVREVRRRWITADDAATWIDDRADLDGRLATLAAVRAHTPRATDRFFLPLLIAQNVERLARWRPERIVRRRVPRGALASAVTATAALALALLLAPGLRPHVPEIVYSDDPIEGTDAGDSGDVPDRVVVAPSRERSQAGGREGDTPGGGDGAAGGAPDDSALARLSNELQDRIRRDLWGREWERMRDAMARAERGRAGRGSGRARGTDDERGTDEDGDGDEPGDRSWETSGLRPPGTGMRGKTARRPGTASEASSDEEAAARGFGDDSDDPETGHAAGETGARGAGNATDPHVFGDPSDVTVETSDRFELGIAAPVRTRRGGPRRASGDPPPASADAHPEPARASRAEHAIRKMPVPPAYESIVREVFAHREDHDE